MKKIWLSCLWFGITSLLIGCGEKEEPKPAPPEKVESPIFKQEIKTLHKAEDLNQVTTENVQQQRQQVDDATK